MGHGKRICLALLAMSVMTLRVGADDGLDLPSTRRVGPRADLRLGATITPRELAGLDPRTVLHDAKTLGLKTIRLGVYWSEVQPDEKTPPDFSKTLEWVRAAEAEGLEVVLTVGVKAPRWPEFYIPSWAEPPADQDEVSKDPKFRERALRFVEETVNAFKGQKAITHWQVENEPMNRSGEASYGPKLLFWRKKARWIGADFVALEAGNVRALDGRPVVVNFWSADERKSSAPWSDSDYGKRNALAIADVIGLDVYPSTGGRPDFGKEDVTSIPRDWLAKARAAGKEAWIVEAQAEPWGAYTPTPAEIARLLDRESAAGYSTIFLWGFEWMERLAHSKDPKEREQGRALLAVVAKYGKGSVPEIPAKTPGLVGALGR